MTTTKLTQTRFNSLVTENNNDIARFTALLADKKRIKEVYGYEETGEEIAKYESLLNMSLELKSEIENGKYYY